MRVSCIALLLSGLLVQGCGSSTGDINAPTGQVGPSLSTLPTATPKPTPSATPTPSPSLSPSPSARVLSLDLSGLNLEGFDEVRVRGLSADGVQIFEKLSQIGAEVRIDGYDAQTRRLQVGLLIDGVATATAVLEIENPSVERFTVKPLTAQFVASEEAALQGSYELFASLGSRPAQVENSYDLPPAQAYATAFRGSIVFDGDGHIAPGSLDLLSPDPDWTLALALEQGRRGKISHQSLQVTGGTYDVDANNDVKATVKFDDGQALTLRGRVTRDGIYPLPSVSPGETRPKFRPAALLAAGTSMGEGSGTATVIKTGEGDADPLAGSGLTTLYYFVGHFLGAGKDFTLESTITATGYFFPEQQLGLRLQMPFLINSVISPWKVDSQKITLDVPGSACVYSPLSQEPIHLEGVIGRNGMICLSGSYDFLNSVVQVQALPRRSDLTLEGLSGDYTGFELFTTGQFGLFSAPMDMSFDGAGTVSTSRYGSFPYLAGLSAYRLDGADYSQFAPMTADLSYGFTSLAYFGFCPGWYQFVAAKPQPKN